MESVSVLNNCLSEFLPVHIGSSMPEIDAEWPIQRHPVGSVAHLHEKDINSKLLNILILWKHRTHSKLENSGLGFIASVHEEYLPTVTLPTSPAQTLNVLYLLAKWTKRI